MQTESIKHEIKICQRCSQSFQCKVDNITECHCFEIVLTKEEREMARKSNDCLCHDCLLALKQACTTQP